MSVKQTLFGTLREANAARLKDWHPDEKPDLAFRGNELAGEVGEACNVIKKLERERRGWPGSRDNVEHLAEELADVIICADLIGILTGIDLSAAVRKKFNETSMKLGFLQRIGVVIGDTIIDPKPRYACADPEAKARVEQ